MEDELRPVTALFADITGSTGLGERLAPDEVKALIGECVGRMSRAVEEFGGSIQAYQGDGICAYFGVPAAHEDDPERAARAALRILELIGEYAADVESAWQIADFNVRVGINSGPAAVGIVGAASPQAVALGDTTNVAARLESIAAPGTVLLGEATARRLEQRFVVEQRGAVTVKNRTEPVRTWRLVRARRTGPERVQTPLVDREQETAQLRTVRDELIAGRGQILLLGGDPGIGKTRLLSELRALVGEDATWLEGACPSYGGTQPYAPFVELLRGWLGAEEGEAEISVRTKARAKLGALLGPRFDELLPAFARLLSIKVDSPQSADDVRGAYRTWVEALASRRPLVLALEDLHFADEPTRVLAEELLAVTDAAPLLLAGTMTAEADSQGRRLRLAALAGFGHRTVDVQLGPLDDEASRELGRRLVPGLDGPSADGIVARAEGNPLYVEELLRALIEGGAVERRRTWTVSLGTAELLPPALESLLIARVDRLPENARHLAQTAAVVGRSFPVRVLEAVHGECGEELAAMLRAEIAREVRRYPELECTFTHGLLHNAALSTLTAASRRDVYARVASAYEELYADALDDHLERLAHYWAQSEHPAQARAYLERAAERAEALELPEQAAQLRRRAATL